MNKYNLREKIERSENSVALYQFLQGNPEVFQLRSKFRDDFEATLPDIIQFLKNNGLQEEDVYRITAMIGELGNNTFDHNLGKWPNGFIGCLIALYCHKDDNVLEILVIDLGVGFKESLKQYTPKPESEAAAIKLALHGATGRIGEKRGNGLRTVTAWMKAYYRGVMRIQSKNGVVEIADDTIHAYDDGKIQGSEVYLRLTYGH